MNIYEKLSAIQNELKAPKGQYNSFGKYKYRSCEDILEAVKPICKKYKATLILSDEIVVLGEGTNQYTKIKDDGVETETHTITRGQRFYIKAIATLFDMEGDGFVVNSAYAREEEEKKGMDGSQITGTASSYARKYALNGLFNIDDTKDADTDEYTERTQDLEEVKISPLLEQALREVIKNEGLEDVKVIDILKKYGYKKLNEIKNKDYKKIEEEFRK